MQGRKYFTLKILLEHPQAITQLISKSGPSWARQRNAIIASPASNGPPGVLGIWGEWLFIFRDLGSTGNYFRGSGEQAHSFGDLGSPAKKQKK